MSTRRAAILAFSALMTLAGCTSSSPSTSLTPSASASASVEPSTSASAAPSATPAALPQRGEVTVDSLPLLDAPGGAGTALATLSRGASILLVETAGDPAWVWVMGLDGDLTDELAIPFGWARERAGGVEQIRREPTTHSTTGTLTVADFRALGPADGLVFYRADWGPSPDIVGFLVEGCGSGASPRSGEPDWLNGTFSSVPVADEVIPPAGPVPDDIIFLRAALGVVASTCSGVAADWYRFSGRFDDPASSTCRTTTSRDGTTIEEVEPAVSLVLCRMRYVITGLEPEA